MHILLSVACVCAVRVWGCEGNGNAGVGSGGGVVAVSACMSGTRGSGILSSTGDVLEMSVVRGVVGVCDMCMCLARGGVSEWENWVWAERCCWSLWHVYVFGSGRCEWMRELVLGFTNPVGIGRVLDMCLCFGCGGVGGVGREWLGAWTRGGSSGVVLCPGICVLCLADTCTFEVHPVFNPVAPYGYLLSDMYLFLADITNPDLFV